ncbi:MAG: hypothetical protein JWM81_1048 [Candidatus Saccharibacteria bacterium]|nr:hypothetical protein [Candidatus Saccharibacteria bacterium]
MSNVISPEKFLDTVVALSEELGDDVYRQGMRPGYYLQRRLEAGKGFPENHFLLRVIRKYDAQSNPAGVRIATHSGTDTHLLRLPEQITGDLEDVDSSELTRLGVIETNCKDIALETDTRTVTVLNRVQYKIGEKAVAAYITRNGRPVYDAVDFVPQQEQGFLTVITGRVVAATDFTDSTSVAANEFDQSLHGITGEPSLVSTAMADMINVISIVTGRNDLFGD